MIKLKKISCAVMSFVMLFAMSTSVFAAEKTTEDFSTPQKSIVCQTNLDEMDLSKSFTLTESYTDNNGTPITITSTFKPALQTRVHMAHPNGRVCGAKRPKCEAERSHHL